MNQQIMFKKDEINYTGHLNPASSDLPALWGGIECSITRVRTDFTDQLELSGHYNRHCDIGRLAELGFHALRFPLLYEKHQPVKDMLIDWTWAGNRLQQLQENNIIPIIGLVHHGSGPSYTNLLSSHFATGLASFASEVAKKFPSVEYYTPVNEPLTTARFSGMYGFWYPHHSNDKSFCRMLINQLTGVVLSMQEIRKINPAAKLVQTEDLGKSYANKGLQYQVDFENERRWLTFDILCGRVDSDHPFWKYFIDNGTPNSALEFFLEHPCPPVIMGLNYYVTSERFLDDNISAYPSFMHGSNGIEKYVDTEAVRVEHNFPSGLPFLLKEVHNRYSLPMALTEVHLNCTREEQLRWFNEIWETCCTLKKEGLDIQAVTAWSLLGAFGWNKLLTSSECEYEPGVFDLRSASPRPTALVKMLRAFSSGLQFHHPLLSQPGWWKRPERISNRQIQQSTPEPTTDKPGAPVLIIGKAGVWGNAFEHICQTRCIPFVLTNRNEMDLSTEQKINAALSFYKPWAIIDVSLTENDNYSENKRQFDDALRSSFLVASHCNRNNILLLTLSSHHVYSGNKSPHYLESDKPDPQDEYGKYIASLEEQVMFNHPGSLIVRTGPAFGNWGSDNFVHKIFDTLQKGNTVQAPADIFISPSYVPDLVNTAMDLLIDEEKGIWHLTNSGALSWYDLAVEICRRAGYQSDLIIPINGHVNKNCSAVLGSERSSIMSSIYCSLNSYFRHHESCNTGQQLVLQKSI